ncbi:MAG: lamin tail domain-containing protein, partial [Patescibacteria group bacterium]
MKTTARARPWRAVAAQVVIATLTLPIGLLESTLSAPLALAADQQISITELQPSGRGFIELMNAGVDTVDLHGWSLWSQSHGEITELHGTLAPGEMQLLETNDLRNAGDTVSLRTSAATIATRVEYGDTMTAHVPAPSNGQSISRIPGSGTLVANTRPTPGALNQSPALVTPAMNATVAASANNPTSTINALT